MNFDQQRFNDFLLTHNVVGFFEKPMTLKSGRQSCWYVNWRNVSNDVVLLDQLTDFVIAFAHSKRLQFDGFYGVPEGATKLGILTNYKWAMAQSDCVPGKYVLSMGRAKPKEHGALQDKYFIGVPKGKVIVLEDVTTTGGSLLETLESLAQVEVEVVAAIGLTNRMQKRDDGKSVEEALVKKGITYFAMSRATDFLPEAMKRFHPSQEIVKSLQQEFAEIGVKPCNFNIEMAAGSVCRAASSDAGNEASIPGRLKRRQKSGV